MRTLPALPGRAVIAALERAGFEVVRIKGSHHFLRHRNDPSRQTACRHIGTICHLAHCAQYCGKRASVGLSSWSFSERVGKAILSSSWSRGSVPAVVDLKDAKRLLDALA
jgi:predicted RNA binding protein YcfA (HicA-like mRNA interferase family)